MRSKKDKIGVNLPDKALRGPLRISKGFVALWESSLCLYKKMKFHINFLDIGNNDY